MLRPAGPRLHAVVLLGLLLTGCRPLLKVTLVSAEERLPHPWFRVNDPDSPQRPRYYAIEVLEDDGKVLWKARDSELGSDLSVADFRYGQPPKGFVTVVAAAPLVSGRRYTLFVSKQGNFGSLRFLSPSDDNPVRSVD